MRFRDPEMEALAEEMLQEFGVGRVCRTVVATKPKGPPRVSAREDALSRHIRVSATAFLLECIGGFQGNVAKAAHGLGLTRSALKVRIRSLGIEQEVAAIRAGRDRSK